MELLKKNQFSKEWLESNQGFIDVSNKNDSKGLKVSVFFKSF